MNLYFDSYLHHVTQIISWLCIYLLHYVYLVKCYKLYGPLLEYLMQETSPIKLAEITFYTGSSYAHM